MRIGWMRISRADYLPKKQERWFSQIVFLKDGIEGDILAVMSQLRVRNIEYGPVIDFFKLGLTREKYKLRLRVDKIPDQPRTSHAIDFNFFTCDPFHPGTLTGLPEHPNRVFPQPSPGSEFVFSWATWKSTTFPLPQQFAAASS